MTGQPFRARFGFDADGNRIIDVGDPVGSQDAVNLQTLRNQAGVQQVARLGNLPSPNDPDPTKRPIDGKAYLIKLDLEGQAMDRLAVWDASQASSGGVAEVQVIEPAADAALITAQAGSSDAGKPFDTGAGTGAVLDLTAMADGTIQGTVTTAGTGYVIGDSLDFAAGSLAWGAAMTGVTKVIVTKLAGASPTGGWRFVDPQVWVRQLSTDQDQQSSERPGDLQATIEGGKEELKVWSGTAWVSIVSTTQIQSWIASLSLFDGTVQEVGGTVVGAVDLTTLTDLTDTTPAGIAAGLAKNSHYHTWVGQAGYVIQATDPNGVGADLTGAVMQVGDWLQVSNRGTAAAPDLHWVHIGGDLLARSRADVLYGMKAWVAGNYETGSIVNYKGSLYRASGAVVPTDGAPGTAGAPWTIIPLTAGVRNVPTDSDLPATAPSTDVYLVLNSAIAGAKPALFSYDTAASKWIQLGGAAAGQTLDLDHGDLMISVGCPIGTVVAWVATAVPAGWLLCDGGTINATTYPELAALFPSGKVPDFRGAFLRGAGLNSGGGGTWGDAARAVGSWQGDSTKRPGTAFTGTTSTDGDHSHDHGFAAVHNHWKGGDPGGPYLGNQPNTGVAGAHSHTVTITGGGDAETRPKNFAVNWIIKATDKAIRVRP